MSKHISLRVPDPIYDRLHEQATEHRTGITGIVLRLIEDHVNQTSRFAEIEAAIDVMVRVLFDSDTPPTDDEIKAARERWLGNRHRH